MNAQLSEATPAPSPSLAVLAGQTDAAQLTRVSLTYVEQRIKLYLRFGEPVRIPGWITGDVSRCSCRALSSAAFAGRPTTTARSAGNSW